MHGVEGGFGVARGEFVLGVLFPDGQGCVSGHVEDSIAWARFGALNL